jgi:YHS domain-containing protein
MKNQLARCRGLALLMVLVAAGTVCAQSELPVFRMDPVELVQGRETPGDPAVFVEYFGFRYLFAGAATKAEFEKDPSRYEIQLGGACGRMGPLSGSGRIDLFAVHDGRIYLFASEGCRKGFLAAPEKLLENDDPAPRGTAVQARRGRELLERAVAAAGGAAAVDGLTSYRQRLEHTENSPAKQVAVSESLLLQFPDRMRVENTWGESCWVMGADGATGYFESSGIRKPMHPMQRRALQRICNRQLAVILKARHRTDFVAFAEAGEPVGHPAVERVLVAFDGSTTTLGIDPGTGRIVSLAYRGRGPGAALGLVERRFAGFGPVGDMTLPRTVEVSFEGKVVADQSGTFAALAVNESTRIPSGEDRR